MVRRSWALAAASIACAPVAAFAQQDDAARVARWGELSHAIFQDRAIESGLGTVRIEAPSRALDASLVPVTVTLDAPRRVTALYLIVDGNPSPLAGTFHFGPAADVHVLRTRLRVDQYTLIQAVAETEDHVLHMASTYVKAAGGCSAPATGDMAAALQRLGQMRLRLADKPEIGAAVTAELLVSHPNANGMQMDPVTRLYTPARYVQSIRVSYAGQKVFDLDADISISEDPAITFAFVPKTAGSLHVEVEDSAASVFRRDFEVPAAGS